MAFTDEQKHVSIQKEDWSKAKSLLGRVWRYIDGDGSGHADELVEALKLLGMDDDE